MLITIYGGGHDQCYVLTTSGCATTNDDFTMEDRYSGLICQHDLENILNEFQRFIKSLHQPKKPHRLVGQFPNIKKGNKQVHDSIDTFIRQLKDDIGENIATRYVRDITGMTKRDDNDEKVFLPHHTSRHQYYSQWCFESGSIVMKKI